MSNTDKVLTYEEAKLLDAVEDDKAGQDRIIAECAARLSLAGEDE